MNASHPIPFLGQTLASCRVANSVLVKENKLLRRLLGEPARGGAVNSLLEEYKRTLAQQSAIGICTRAH